MNKGMRAADDEQARKNMYFRADRISVINNQFYFATREGTMEGPYRTKEEALWEIECYIRRMTTQVSGPATSTSSLSFSLALAER